MKRVSTITVLVLLIMISCKQEKKEPQTLQLGDFSLSEAVIMPNKTIDITYNGELNPEEESLYYYMVDDKAYPVDLNFTDKKASFTLPDSAQAVAFNVKIDGKYLNNNKQGYMLPVSKSKTEEAIGNKAAIDYYASTYGKEYGIRIPKDSVLKSIKNDIEKHPKLKDVWNMPFLRMAYLNNKKEGEKLINENINSLATKSDMTADDYSDLIGLYRTLRKKEPFDSVTRLAVEKFPNGTIAKNNLIDKFFQQRDIEKKEIIYDELKAKFSNIGKNEKYMLSSLARGYDNKGNKEKASFYIDKIRDKNTKASLFNSIAWALAEKGEDLEYAAETSKKSLDLMKSLEGDMSNKPNYITELMYKRGLDRSYGMFADTYALILFKQGKLKEAIKYQKLAVDKSKSADTADRYLEFLIADNQNELAVSSAEDFLKNNTAGSKTKDYFKKAYAKQNPDAKDVDEKIAAAEKVGYDKYKAEIKKGLIDEDAPQFTLKDLEGKDVSLASLKGKVTVLDFWATWCGPCKASFPSMQNVVTKYKDSDKVKLLFINTLESGEDREKSVSDFIKDNNYTFHVLLDEKVKGSNSFEVAEKYGVTGIPTKVIIGPDGRMKYKSVGFSGDPTKVVKEIDIIVDVLND